MTKLEVEYQKKYGDLPFESELLLEDFAKKHKLNFEYLEKEEERIKNIPWHTIEFVIPVIPKASPRPKYSSITKNFYVKGAATTKKMIQKYIDHFGLICTRAEFHLEVFIPIPDAMTMHEKYLAEKRLIRPIQTPDFDNVAKTYSDALQGILIVNDNILNPGTIEKYYSFKPRVHVTINYQDAYDCQFNEKKIMQSILYKNRERNDIRDGHNET